jgi:hypothetical protein
MNAMCNENKMKKVCTFDRFTGRENGTALGTALLWGRTYGCLLPPSVLIVGPTPHLPLIILILPGQDATWRLRFNSAATTFFPFFYGILLPLRLPRAQKADRLPPAALGLGLGVDH